MIQEIDSSLWAEFQEELEKVKTQVALNLNTSGNIISKSLRLFFEKFLSIQFPEGQINQVLEKNFAIYICQNNIPLESIQGRYKSQNWDVKGLLGWVKKVQTGELKTFNLKELLQWSNENNHFEVELLEKAKLELEINKDFKVYRDNEFKNYVESTQTWQIEKWIGQSKIIILAGKRSTCKSWLALTMAYSLSHGKPLFDKFESVQNIVIYADRENGFSELKKRAGMIKAGLNLQDTPNLIYFSENPVKLDDSVSRAYLEEIIESNKASLIIIDTYRRFISFDENDAQQVSNLFVDILKPLCEKHKCSFLIIHHEKKGEGSDEMDMLRGSSDLANYADGIIQISRKGNNLILKQTKNRGTKELEPFEVSIETDETSFFRLKYKGAVQYAQDRIAQTLIDWIIETGKNQFTYSEGLSYAETKGFAKQKYIEALKKLETQGLIAKSGGFKSPYVISGDLSKLGGLTE